jgi:hypothetical protein
MTHPVDPHTPSVMEEFKKLDIGTRFRLGTGGLNQETFIKTSDISVVRIRGFERKWVDFIPDVESSFGFLWNKPLGVPVVIIDSYI